MADGATIRIQRGAVLSCTVEIPGLRVRVVAGPEAGRRAAFPIETIRIGSDEDNELRIVDPSVSRRHAEVRVREDGLQVVDLGSANGTWHAGARLKEAVLPPGSHLRLGDTELILELGTEERTGLAPREDGLGDLVGGSPPMRELFGLLRAVAASPVSVLLLGESGTGKEGAARTLHRLSGRPGSFEVFDAGSTDPELIRSDLFGHTRGAFTGAVNSREGAFRRAHRGTLFLDEIGELPKDLQSHLLRVIETREVAPVGGDRRQPVDVRLVAATHRDLEAEAGDGRFRLDLYHRLSVVPVRMPALRERLEDLPMLVEHFRDSLGLACRFSSGALERMAAHSWPGNVRELRNLVERCGVLAAGREVTEADLGPSLGRGTGIRTGQAADAAGGPGPGPGAADPSGRGLADLERSAIETALARHGGNRERAARELGISPATLYRRLKSYRD